MAGAAAMGLARYWSGRGHNPKFDEFVVDWEKQYGVGPVTSEAEAMRIIEHAARPFRGGR